MALHPAQLVLYTYTLSAFRDRVNRCAHIHTLKRERSGTIIKTHPYNTPLSITYPMGIIYI